jgi:hypothetical protein
MTSKSSQNVTLYCGRWAKSHESFFDDSGIPDFLRGFVQGIARNARKDGISTGYYRDYIVTGQATQNPDRCAVDIMIMSDETLWGHTVLNSCK